jgi:hypothetical protein
LNKRATQWDEPGSKIFVFKTKKPTSFGGVLYQFFRGSVPFDELKLEPHSDYTSSALGTVSPVIFIDEGAGFP